VTNAFGTPEKDRVLFLISQDVQKRCYWQAPSLSSCSSTFIYIAVSGSKVHCSGTGSKD